MKLLSGLSLAVLILLGVRAGAQSQYDNLDYSSFGSWAASPATGFNYKKKEFTGYTCVTGAAVAQAGKPEANLDFSLSLDSSSVKRELGIAADAKTLIGSGEVSGAAKFLKASTEDSTSVTLNYVGTIHFANLIFNATGLNDYGKAYAKLPSQMEASCGQGFVQQIVRGAKLFFSIRFDFSSRDDKDAFSTELHYKSPMSSINFSANSSSEMAAKRARVTISAYQMGGQVEKLAFIFKNNPGKDQTDKADGGQAVSRFAAIECSFGNVDQCRQALSDALQYATDQKDPQSFPNQIDSKMDPQDPKANQLLANLSYLIVPYHFPEMIQIPGLNDAVEQDKKELYEELAENIDDLNQIDNLRHGVISYTDAQLKTFGDGEAILRKRQSEIVDTALFCYTQDELKCGDRMKEMDAKLTALIFDKAVLDPAPLTYAQYCAATYSIKPKYVELDLRKSVLAVQEILLANYKADLDKQGYSETDNDLDHCSILEHFMLSQPVLDLSYSGQSDKIRSLEVIRNLTQLQSLKIRNQEVRAIDALAGFRDLTDLDAEGNQIRDVTPLANLTQLETLHLARNRIRSTQPLQNLPYLALLDIRANQPGAECFESASLKQCLLQRSKWMVQFSNDANTSGMDLSMGQVSAMPDGYVLTGARADYRSNFVAKLKSENGPQGFSVTRGTLESARFWNADAAIDATHVLVTGGWPTYSLNQMAIYDTTLGQQVASGQLIDGRAGHTATRLDSGLILVAGGYDSTAGLYLESALSTAELIDPFAAGGPKTVKRLEMNGARAWATATKLADGRVLFVGGYAGGRGVRMIEVYDPKDGLFHIVGNLQVPRGGHTITELQDHSLLVVGGFKDAATALSSAEILDPKTFKSRLVTGELSQARGMHSAVLLPNGEVLILGGATRPGGGSTSIADALDLVQVLPTSIAFRDEPGATASPVRKASCASCLTSAEIYLPDEGYFVPNPEFLNLKRAGMAIIPVTSAEASASFRIWGGIDQRSASSMETGVVTEDPLN